MALVPNVATGADPGTAGKGGGSTRVVLILAFAVFFLLGGVTNINDLLVGKFKPMFHLTHAEANLVQMAFFIAYAALSAGAVQVFARRLSWGFVCVLLVLMGIGLEYLQAQMAMGRMLDRYDALANTVGVLAGLATAFTPWRDALLRFDGGR